MPITPTAQDLDERRARRLGRRPRSTSSRTRCTTAWACSRASAPTRPIGGPGHLPPHRAHRAAPQLGPDHDDGHPLLGRRAGRGHQARRARVAACRRCYIRPIAYYGYGEMGLNTLPVLGRRRHRLLAVGRLPGRRRRHQGRAHEDQLVDPPRPQHHAAGVEDHRQLRQLLARQGRGAQGRLRRGDHAQPAGLVAECTGENIFVARHGKLITPPLAAGALEGITQCTVMAIADDLGFEVVDRRPHPLRPLRRRRDVRVRHRRRGLGGQLASTTAPSRAPGPMTTAIADEYAKLVRGQVDQYKDWVEHVALTRCRARRARRASRSSTPRCATAPSSRASRCRSRTSSASPSSSTGSASAGSRAATRRPTRRTRSSSAGPAPSCASRPPSSSPSARPAARPARSTSTPRCQALVEAGTPTACIVGKSWDFHVTEALGTTLDEGVAMVGDSVRVPARPRACGSSSTPSTSSTATRPTPSSRCGCSRPRPPRAPSARAVRHQRRLAAPRGAAHRRRGPRLLRRRRSHRHPHPERLRLRGGQLGRRRASAAPRQLQGTVNGYGERTGNANLMTVIPNLELKMGCACLPEGRLERLTAVSAATSPSWSTCRRTPPTPTSGPRRSPTRAGCTPRRWAGSAAPAYEHVDPGVVGNHTRVLVSDLGGRAGMAMKAEEFGVDLDDRAAGRAGRAAEASSRREGYVFEAADASLELLMRRATGWEQPIFTRRGLPGHDVPPRG